MRTRVERSNHEDITASDLISVEQVCLLLGVGRSTLQRWRAFAPEFPKPVCIGPNTIRFYRRELLQRLRTRERT